MRTQTHTLFILVFLLAIAFLFSGCHADAGTIDTDRIVAPEVHSDNTQTHHADTKVEPVKKAVVSRVSDVDKTDYLDAINAARAETQDCGSAGVFDPAPDLRWDDRLGNAAWEHSDDMAQSNTFAHDGSGTASDRTAQEEGLGRGSHFTERIRHQGYTDYRAIGENIAAGAASAQDVIAMWLQSDQHCANLMNPNFSDTGMALVEKSHTDDGTYWSLELGGH